MQHLRFVSSALGVLATVSACASVPGTASRGGGETSVAGVLSPALANGSDSARAAQTAPSATISTMVSSADGMRRVRANFHVDRDAYVVMGHIDADGNVRIVYPASPHDSGFVRAKDSYHTDEFFAGFNAEYRARERDRVLVRGPMRDMDAYDGGLGYLFLIASSHPLHMDSLATDGKWNRYELDGDDYMRDPRPDVNDLAKIATGGDSTAYSIKFASFYTTVRSGF